MVGTSSASGLDAKSAATDAALAARLAESAGRRETMLEYLAEYGVHPTPAPGFRVQEIDDRFSRQGAKPVLDLNALWRFNPDASLRLTVSNAGARRYDSGSTTVREGTTISSTGGSASSTSAITRSSSSRGSRAG